MFVAAAACVVAAVNCFTSLPLTMPLDGGSCGRALWPQQLASLLLWRLFYIDAVLDAVGVDDDGCCGHSLWPLQLVLLLLAPFNVGARGRGMFYIVADDGIFLPSQTIILINY